MTDYQKYINALRKCANEHENDTTSTGHVIVSDLCRDTANLLEELSSLEKPNKSEIPTGSTTKDGISNKSIIYKAKESKEIQEDLNKLSELNKPITKNCESCEYYGLHYEVCNYCYKCSLWTEKESTPKNDLGVEQDLVSTITETITEQVTESHEEFIFEIIRPYCEKVVQMKISKLELERALLKYYGKNDLADDCISRADAIKAMQDKAKGLKNEDTINGLCGAVAILYEMPPVTPIRPKGHWIEEFNNIEGEVRFTCSNCRKYQLFGTDFCYHCGSDNRSEE